MAEDHGCEPGRDGVEIEIGDVVQQPEQQPTDFDNFGRRKLCRPRLRIDIAAHGVRRRQRAQRVEHLGPADVAGVDDHVRSPQRRHRLGPQKAMRIGDDADDSLFAAAHWTYEMNSSSEPSGSRK